MDETKAKWFRWIAAHSPGFFWGLWGAGAGAFLLVLTKAVDGGGDFARFYLAVLAALMGGIFGLISARGMDKLADSREVRRKANVARLRLARLRGPLDTVLILMDDPTTEQNLNAVDLRTTDRFRSARNLVVSALNAPPDFEAFVDTEEDLELAYGIERVFQELRQLFGIVLAEDNHYHLLSLWSRLASERAKKRVRNALPFLLRVERHLSARASA